MSTRQTKYTTLIRSKGTKNLATGKKFRAMADDQVEMMEGLEITDELEIRRLMTEDEKGILAVYRRFEELQFEIAVLKAKGVLSHGETYSRALNST